MNAIILQNTENRKVGLFRIFLVFTFPIIIKVFFHIMRPIVKQLFKTVGINDGYIKVASGLRRKDHPDDPPLVSAACQNY